jgi:hypothetical protein
MRGLWVLLTACDPGGFKVLDTGAGVRLEGISVERTDRIVAAGDRGIIVEYELGEITTTSTDADVGPRLPGFYGVLAAGETIRVAGDQGTILARGPADPDFVAEASRTQARLLMLMAATPSILYAAGEDGRVVRKRGSASGWERVDIHAGNAKVTGGWAGGSDAVAFTTDSGLVIDRVGDDFVATPVATGTTALPLFDVFTSTKGEDTYAVGLAGSIYLRPSGEDTFEPMEAPVSQDLYGIFGTGPDRIFIVGAQGTILRWDGVEWRGVPSGTSADLFDVDGTPDGSLVAASGDDGIIVILEE